MTDVDDAVAEALDPLIHQPARLRILAALHKNRQLDFGSLRDGLGLTPGNLGAHLERLEAGGYVASARVLVGLGFEMRYRITPEGSAAFRAYAARLRALLDASGAGDPPDARPLPRPPPWPGAGGAAEERA